MTTRIAIRTLLLSVLLCTAVSIGKAQTATYHLHKDASTTSGAFQLLTAGPNATAFAINSQNLKNVAAGEYIIKGFDTQAGTPNLAGVIPANSAISFTVWMKKSSTSGVIYPRVKLFVNNSSGALLGTVTGGTALSSTITQYTFNVNTSSAVTMSASDRFYVWVGVNVATAPTSNTDGVLSVEGTLNGSTDSYVTVPLPNAPPTVSLTSPINNSSYTNPASITLSTNASDSDGNISKVEFFEGANKLGEVTSSPFNFTWNNPTPASLPYVLTAKATDNTSLTTTSGAISVTVAGNGNLFNSSSVPASSTTVDISAEGTSDWAHYGLNAATDVDRKDGVTAQISHQKIGGNPQIRLNDATFSQKWTGGTPTAISNGTTSGIYTQSTGNGFQITVPADTTAKVLRLYVGLWAAQAKMEATLSDGSAPALIDTSFANSSGVSHSLFTINFKAASAGQTLTVKYTVLTTFISGANVTLDSATLFPSGGGGSGTLSGSFANPGSNINLTTDGTSDWAHWGLNSATAFDHKSSVLSEIGNVTKIGGSSVSWLNDNPTSFTWTGGTPTASATNTQSGIFISGVGNGFQFNVPADTEEKTLKIYTGLWRGTGRLEATLSDGSAAPFIDTSLSNGSGTSNGVYTITFKAASVGQSLRVRYTNSSSDPVGNVTLEAATLQYSAPAITSLSSNSGPVGGSITITGSNFGLTKGNSTISFNGLNGTPTSWSSTTIVVPVPSGATSGNIVATVRGVASNAMSFTVTPGISSLSPSSGAVGSSITITGTNFGANQGTSTVSFNGTTATPTSWSNTSIVAPVPAGATTGNVIVTVGGLASNGVAFSVGPNISSISPAAAPIGDSVTISGTNFGSSQGSSTVTFNGTAATPTNWSDTSIIVPVPSAASGSVVVTVNGLASSGFSFGVSPKITGISPSIASTGQSVVISGTSFGASQGTSTVTFNGTAGTPSSWSGSSITVPVPSGATSGNVVVTVGGLASSGFAFTVASHITSLSPTSGAVGDSITVTGTDFGTTQGSSTITFNGTSATPSSWSNTSITVSVPTGATSGPVVTTVAGVAGNSVSFTVKPKITAIDPGSGSAGAAVTITGTTFGATQGSSTITFNGATGTPTSWSDTSISVLVPNAATAGPIVVTVNGSASNGMSFNVTTTGALSGKVTVAGSTTPIAGATVKAIQGSSVIASVTTNGTGEYTFDPLIVGTYTVEASATGYGTKRRGLVNVTVDPTVVNLALDQIVSGPVSYIYDTVGRLVSTVGPTETVIYTYDAVGNLLSISRQSASQVSIVNFTPGSGAVGTSVTINGSGFSSTASQNTVQFNGTAATVTSAITTRLEAVVPSNATTGQITVTSPNGSASSSSSFTVGQAGAPVISSFTPTIGVLGDAVTLSGSNFAATAADNKVKFNNTQAQITSANTTTVVARVSTTVSSKISITTPDGTAVAAGDFFVPPPPRTVADVEYTARMSIGQSLTPSISTANKIAMVLFDGTAGQKISMQLGPATIAAGFIDFYKPDGTTLIDTQGFVPWANQKFIEPFPLPTTGTYTMVMRGDGTATGGIPISLYEVPPDVTGSLTVGGSAQQVTNTVPGQNANLTLSGTQGQQISLLTSGSTITGAVTIKKPDGTDLASAFFSPPGSGNEAFIDKQILPVSGTYTVFVNPGGNAIGTTNVRLYDASDSSGTMTPGGGPTTVTITTPGQNVNLTFNGSNGQRIALSLTSSNIAYDVYIKRPDNSVVVHRFINSGWTGDFIDALTLDTSGTYTILVDPTGSFTGSVTLNLYDVPADLTGSLSIGGAAIPVTISAVGQNASYTFDGTANQQVTVHITGSNYSCVVVSLLDSGGTTLTSAGPCTASFNLSTWTLPATGTYTVKVDPATTATGTLNLNVTNP
jgi:YD repeat-containing protein